MPMVPELPVTMLACARLGVIHSQVFGGFSGQACGTRIADSGSRVLITMDGYYRAGSLTDHKVKADEAVGRGGQAGPGGRQGAGLAAAPRPVRLADADGRRAGTSSSTSCCPGTAARPWSRCRCPPRRRCSSCTPAGPPAGPRAPALHRRLPGLRGRHVEVLPGHPPGRRVLVHGRHRLDHRALLHRLRPAGAGHHDGDLRGRAELPRWRAAVADRREARGEHLPHLADRHPDAAQGRPGGAEEVQLPLQVHDDRGRADRARGVALVLLRGRQGRGGHHRHLVADRDRRLPWHHPARPCSR